VSRDTPTDPPDGFRERVHPRGGPLRSFRVVKSGRPNIDRPVFRGRRNGGMLRQEGRRPGHIADPVRVGCGRQRGLHLPRGGGAAAAALHRRRRRTRVDAHGVIAGARDQAQKSSGCSRRLGVPVHGIDAPASSPFNRNIFYRPSLLLRLVPENGDTAIGTGGGQQQSRRRRRKGHTVHRRRVQADRVMHDAPMTGPDFLVHSDAAVQRSRGQQGAELRMGPGDLPDRPGVQGQRGGALVGRVGDVVDLNGAVCWRIETKKKKQQ
jgi:hypothetical protein